MIFRLTYSIETGFRLSCGDLTLVEMRSPEHAARALADLSTDPDALATAARYADALADPDDYSAPEHAARLTALCAVAACAAWQAAPQKGTSRG